MWIISLAFGFLAHLVDGENRELVAVDLLFRHGDRTPIDPYPNDPYKDPSQWPVGFGQLTSKGKMVHFKLGQYLRKRYNGLLPKDYSETDIYVRSTDVDRTLMSAMSDLAGLYPPTKRWNKNIDWQPIPVHTEKVENDGLLLGNNCPKYKKLQKEVMVSDDVQRLNKEYGWVYKYVSNYTGSVVDNLRSADYLKDTLYIEDMYNKTLPDWTSKVYPQPLKTMQTISFQLDTWTPAMKRLRCGPFIKKLIKRMEGIQAELLKNKSHSTFKMMMYSGHDSTIASLLNSLNMFDPPIAPPYASCIMMEMYHNKDTGNVELRLLYRNQTDREPFQLDYSGCGEYCPVDEFRRRAKELLPEDWDAECSLGYEEETWIGVLTVVCISITALLLMTLIVSVIVSLARRRHQGTTYSSFPTEES